ncbi:MAG: RHS repeat-associated core domain-containing protein [Pyrinomonadaceae bacterium]
MWDYENRLKQASKTGVTVSYTYDALGRRVQRTSSTGGTTKFVYDGADVVRDLDGSGATTADYLNGPGIDNKIRQTVSGTGSYFFTDHLGTTRGLTVAGGSVTSSLSYDSFGTLTSGSTSTRYTYTGREIDSDTALMYYRARFYDPGEGRFISEDPIGFRGGDINLYSYVNNNPLRFSDPQGTQGRSDAKWQPGEVAAMRRLADHVRSMGSCPGGTSVYICCRDIDMNVLTKFFSKATGVRHCFIKTPNVEAEMNPAANAPQPIWPFGTRTEITPHTGQSKTALSCVPACNVDQECVEHELEIGKPTGRWALTNNCNTLVTEIVRKCQKTGRKYNRCSTP